MKSVFVDTQYWGARFHPRDQWHEEARAAEEAVADRSLVTSESVLVEFLNFFGSFRPGIRTEAAHIAGELYEDASIEVVAMSLISFDGACGCITVGPTKRIACR